MSGADVVLQFPWSPWHLFFARVCRKFRISGVPCDTERCRRLLSCDERRGVFVDPPRATSERGRTILLRRFVDWFLVARRAGEIGATSILLCERPWKSYADKNASYAPRCKSVRWIIDATNLQVIMLLFFHENLLRNVNMTCRLLSVMY